MRGLYPARLGSVWSQAVFLHGAASHGATRSTDSSARFLVAAVLACSRDGPALDEEADLPVDEDPPGDPALASGLDRVWRQWPRDKLHRPDDILVVGRGYSVKSIVFRLW